MLIHPRVALASGLAAVAGAALLIAGRLDGSVVTAVLLVVAARAAAPAAAEEQEAAGALGRLASSVPVWAAVALVAAVRAGSDSIADVRGANAVAGLAIARGDAAMVAGSWCALVAGGTAVLAGLGRGGRLVTAWPVRSLELLAIGVQALLLAMLFAGPQVDGADDLIPWAVAIAMGSGALLVARGLAGVAWLPRAAVALAAVGAGLALLGRAP